MGSIFAEKARYGSDAVTTNPAKSVRALGSAFRGMRPASCDFIFGTVRLSAVQDRSRNKRPPHTAQARGLIMKILMILTSHDNRKYLPKDSLHSRRRLRGSRHQRLYQAAPPR